MSEYTTKTGRVLGDEEIEALADEAEKGYCVEYARKGTGTGTCGRPLPCDRPGNHIEAP